MRFATAMGVAVLSVASSFLTVPAYSQPGTSVTAFGLQYTPLGGAVLTYDALARQLSVSNIGSSGNDGVSVELGSGVAALIWGGPFHGGSPDDHCAVMHGTSGLTGLPLSCELMAQRNSDGSIDLEPIFSGVGATGCWVMLLDASGHLIHRVYKPLPFSVHVSASTPFTEATTAMGMGKGFYQWIKAAYDRRVSVDLGAGAGGTIECDDVLFGVAGATGGEPFASMTRASLEFAVPSPTVPYVITGAGIVPPCAGCPNGPDDDAALSAEGGALWQLNGTASAPLAISNIGSSGQDGVSMRKCPCPRESPTKTSLGIVIDEQPLAPGTLTCLASGSVGGVDQSLGQLHCFVESDHSEFEPDFSAAGSTGYRVLLYSQGVVVADVTNPLSRASHAKPQTQWLVQADQIGGSGPMEFRIICITSPCPGWTVALDGSIYLVDEIVFQPVGAAVVIPAGLAEMSLLAAHFSTSTLLPTTGATLPIYGVTSSPLQPALSAPRSGAAEDIAGAIASPNPTSGPTLLVFTLPRDGKADVAVIDAAGRKVRGLASAVFKAGAHQLAWDGRDDRGRLTGPGVYFVRIESGTTTRVSRVTRLW